MRIAVTWRQSDRRLRLALEPGSKMLAPMRRTIEVSVAGEKASKPIVFDGKPVEVRL
jgi:hypothetical protein